MLPRKLRLTGRHTVELVYQKGTKAAGQYLLVRRLPNRSNAPRVAVVVSTAVSKRATQRNRAKRVIRALLRELRLPPVDLIVTVRRLPKEENWSHSFRKDLLQCFPAK